MWNLVIDLCAHTSFYISCRLYLTRPL